MRISSLVETGLSPFNRLRDPRVPLMCEQRQSSSSYTNRKHRSFTVFLLTWLEQAIQKNPSHQSMFPTDWHDCPYVILNARQCKACTDLIHLCCIHTVSSSRISELLRALICPIPIYRVHDKYNSVRIFAAHPPKISPMSNMFNFRLPISTVSFIWNKASVGGTLESSERRETIVVLSSPRMRMRARPRPSENPRGDRGNDSAHT